MVNAVWYTYLHKNDVMQLSQMLINLKWVSRPIKLFELFQYTGTLQIMKQYCQVFSTPVPYR